MPITSFEPSIRLCESEWETGNEGAEMIGTIPVGH